MRTVRIQDTRAVIHDDHLTPLLALDLSDILPICGAYADRTWVAWAVDCTGSFWCDKLINAPNEQLSMSFGELTRYAHEVTQTVDGYFFALQPNVRTVPQLDSVADGVAIADLIIHAHDATFWEVTTADEGIINRIGAKFKRVSIYGEMMHDGFDS
jgi:hypothetical protein